MTRCSDVAMFSCRSVSFVPLVPCGPQQLLKFGTVKGIDLRIPIVPAHVDAVLDVREVIKVQFEGITFRIDDLAELFQIFRFFRREPNPLPCIHPRSWESQGRW